MLLSNKTNRINVHQTIFLLLLIVCNSDQDEVKPPSIVVPRPKPPFNGSIFGKRSPDAARQGFLDQLLATSQQQQQQQKPLDTRDDRLMVSLLQQRYRQQEARALWASIGRCLDHNEFGIGGSSLCDELLTIFDAEADLNKNFNPGGLSRLINQLVR